jgi:outer membrane protein assembly factor BamA
MAARLAGLLLIGAVCGLLPHAAFGAPPDPLEGLIVREIRVTGLRNLPPDAIIRHLATRTGEPFRRKTMALDQRRLDELRLFSAVDIRPELDVREVVLRVDVTETLRVLPVVMLRVTDENGVSAGGGVRTINMLGRGTQAGASVLFGGDESVNVIVDKTTITPGTWSRHTGISYSSRRNSLYDFDERATTIEFRIGRNVTRGLKVGGLASLLAVDTGSSGASLSADGEDLVPTLGTFVTLDTLDSSTNPRNGTWAEVEVDWLSGDARSWTVILDGRRFQRLADRHGLGLFSLASFQSGDVGVHLPEYLQFALGGANTVRGWTLGSQTGRNQFIGTGEYTYVVRDVTPFSVFGFNAYAGLQLAAFADVGLAWTDSTDRTWASTIDGYGVGVRLLVPFVDLIRIDVAWGAPERGATAYFGVSLKAARQRQRVR